MKPKKISAECLKEFTKEGFSQSEIARTCNMSRQGVHQRLKYTHKLPKKRKLLIRLLKEGRSVAHISKKLNHKNLASTYQLLRRYGYYIPPSKILHKRASIIFLASKGYTYQEIANEIDTSRQSVYWIVKRNKIKIRSR